MPINIPAGSRLPASALNAFVPIYVEKTLNQTNTGNTNANDNAFANISFGADQTWECRLCLNADAPTGADIKLIWATTGGVQTFTRWCYGPGVSTTGTNDTTANMANRDNTSVTYGTGNSTSLRAGIIEHFRIVTVGSSGTITLQWSQSGTPSGTLTVYAGSYFVAHRVS